MRTRNGSSSCLNPRRATFAVRPVIEQIVAGVALELTGNQSRFLSRRGLPTIDGKLAFPILGSWLQEYADLWAAASHYC